MLLFILVTNFVIGGLTADVEEAAVRQWVRSESNIHKAGGLEDDHKTAMSEKGGGLEDEAAMEDKTGRLEDRASMEDKRGRLEDIAIAAMENKARGLRAKATIEDKTGGVEDKAGMENKARGLRAKATIEDKTGGVEDKAGMEDKAGGQEDNVALEDPAGGLQETVTTEDEASGLEDPAGGLQETVTIEDKASGLEDPASLRQWVVSEHNRHRAENGAGPLRLDDKLTENIQNWVEQLTTGIRDGQNPHQDLSSLHRPLGCSSIAENLAEGPSQWSWRRWDPAQRWMDSRGHREAMLDNVYSRVGVGLAEAKDGKKRAGTIFCE